MRFYSQKFNIKIPPPNVPLLQHKIAVELGFDSQSLARIILIHQRVYPGYVPQLPKAQLTDAEIMAPFITMFKIQSKLGYLLGILFFRILQLSKTHSRLNEFTRWTSAELEFSADRLDSYLSFCKRMFFKSTPESERLQSLGVSERHATPSLPNESIEPPINYQNIDSIDLDASLIVPAYEYLDEFGYYPVDYAHFLKICGQLIGRKVKILEKAVYKFERLLFNEGLIEQYRLRRTGIVY